MPTYAVDVLELKKETRRYFIVASSPENAIEKAERGEYYDDKYVADGEVFDRAVFAKSLQTVDGGTDDER